MGWLISVITHPGAMTVIGAAAAWVARKALGARRWAAVRKRAAEIVGDPRMPIEDPREAVEKALTEAMQHRIRQQSVKVQKLVNGHTNGTTGKPR